MFESRRGLLRLFWKFSHKKKLYIIGKLFNADSKKLFKMYVPIYSNTCCPITFKIRI